MPAHIPIRLCVRVWFCTLGLWVCSGCISVEPARSIAIAAPGGHAARAEAPDATPRPEDPGAPGSVWPARWGESGTPIGAVVPSRHGPERLRPAHLGPLHALRVGDLEYEHARALAEAVGKDDGFRFEPEGPGSMVFLPPMTAVDPGDGKPDPDAPASTLVFVTGRRIEQRDGLTEERIELQRTWIACYDAHPSAEQTIGTIVLVPGMLGTPQPIIEGMVRYWRRAGFSVVRLLSHPSRFTERVEVEVAPGEEAEVGRRLAGIYDERTAENAYAVDAGIESWLDARPALAGLPFVYVGMSGGAIVGPATLTYRPDRFDAAVLIAGGVDFLSISATSNYADWIDAVTIDWEPDDPDSEGKPTPERLALLSEAYLGASKLDGMHRAPLIEIPTLLLHASRDRAVSARYGQTLWNRLGRPERWVFPVGHELIFVMLPTQADRMDAWIKETIGRSRDGDGR